MFNKEAIELIMQGYAPEVKEINGAKYTTKQLFRIEEPVAAKMQVKSLRAIIDFIESGIDDLGDVYIHIMDPRSVYVTSALNKDQKRTCFLHAQADPCNFRFGQFVDAETFIIGLQAQFTDGMVNDRTDKGTLLQYIGTMTEVHESKMADDGVSQTATVKTGIAAKGEKVAPNPVNLSPYRTFIEVEQPISSFVLRLKEGGYAALFEADGGAWEREAVGNIREYLEKELEPGDACRPFRVTILA